MKKHIFLTGMPGSGKTSLGKAAAEILQLPFYEMDEMIAADAGMTIPAIFAEFGEDGFRDREHAILQMVCTQPAGIVSTGGGAVTFQRNARLMQENGSVVMIDRPLEMLLSRVDMSGRPLLAGKGADAVRTMYEKRMPVYRSTADVTVVNDSGFAAVLQRLLTVCRGGGQA